MDLIGERITQLKNMVSLRYVDPLLRERALTVLKSFGSGDEYVPELQICSQYIVKVEQLHDKMLHQISNFLELLTPFINECQNTLESTQQQLAENAKMRRLQLSEQQDIEHDMKQTMEMMSRQLNLRDQENKELVIKLEEKDSIIYSLEKEQSQYFKKMEEDFQKQQKALEESFTIILRLQQEVKTLKFENLGLRENQDSSHSAIAIIESVEINNQDYSSEQVNSSQENSPNSTGNQLNYCSLISSHSQKFSQFEELQKDEQHLIEQREELVLEGERQGSPGLTKVQTLKEILNVSVQKEYKLQYNNYESLQEREQKENYRLNWLVGSKSNSIQKCEQWALNNSLDLMEQHQTSKRSVKEFKLNFHGNSNNQLPANVQSRKQLNPYYAYFLIASQNVKIRSKYFQELCLVEAGPFWQVLLGKSVPLHEWEREIERYFMKSIKKI